MTTSLYLGIATALGLLGCGAPQASVVASEPVSALAIDLSVTGDPAALTAHCAARNVSSAPVQVFDWPRMPYLLDDRGTLVVLHGISPPPEDRDLNTIEIPMTRTLAPGESLSFDAPLSPLKLRSHYGDEPAGQGHHGATAIVCRVAHGATPIDAAARAHTTIATLLTWQQIESSPTLVVRLP